MMRSRFLISIFLVLLIGFVGCETKAYQTYTNSNQSIDSTNNGTELESIIAPYRTEVDAKMNEIIGYCDSTLLNGAPESPLGNFVADIVFQSGYKNKPVEFDKMDSTNTISLINFGGLRAPISKGEITVGTIFELMPFDNTISIVKINRSGIFEMIDYFMEKNGQPVSNVVFKIRSATFDIIVNDTNFDVNQELFIITSDYLASGGDKMNFLLDRSAIYDTGVLMRDAIMRHIQNIGTVHNNGISNRMIIKQ